MPIHAHGADEVHVTILEPAAVAIAGAGLLAVIVGLAYIVVTERRARAALAGAKAKHARAARRERSARRARGIPAVVVGAALAAGGLVNAQETIRSSHGHDDVARGEEAEVAPPDDDDFPLVFRRAGSDGRVLVAIGNKTGSPALVQCTIDGFDSSGRIVTRGDFERVEDDGDLVPTNHYTTFLEARPGQQVKLSTEFDASAPIERYDGGCSRIETIPDEWDIQTTTKPAG